MCVYIYIITQTVVTTAFVNLFEKAPISRDLSFKHLPLPLVALLYSLQNRADRSHPFAAIGSANVATSRARIYPSVLVCIVNDAMPSIVRFFRSFFLSFLLFFFSKIVGRRTRVIGQGSKTWKGYRNSLFPPFLLSSFSHLISISSLLFVSLSLSLSSPLFLSVSSLSPSEKNLNAYDGK